jgi:hypothetical protein
MGGASVTTASAATLAEFTAALEQAADPAGRLVLIEARLPRLDVPEYAASLASALRVPSPPGPVDEEIVSPVPGAPVRGGKS